MADTVNCVKAPKAIGPYSHAKIVNGLIFISGQTGINPEAGEAEESFKSQAEQCMKNVKAILETAGSNMEKIVKTTCFLADIDDFSVFNYIYASFFKENKPARSCFAVKSLPKGFLCEVEAIAEI